MSESSQLTQRRDRALAAWNHFDQEIDNEVLRAVCAAYVIVACADGHFEESEIQLFLDMIKDTRSFASVDLAALEREFRDLGSAVVEDLADGKALAFSELARVKGDADKSALVVSAAQIALLANGQQSSGEELLLRQICQELGLDPDAY